MKDSGDGYFSARSIYSSTICHRGNSSGPANRAGLLRLPSDVIEMKARKRKRKRKRERQRKREK